jgi:integrase
VAQSVIEAQRSKHEEFVFVYRRERVKNIGEAPAMPYRAIETMNNTAWQRARREAGLPDLHVHDLRHTVGMRLREAGVPQSTVADILWHSNPSMTRHYSTAQIVGLHAALKKIKEDTGRWNKSLATLRREHGEAMWGTSGEKSPPKAPQPRKTA